jgi:hypothetical protein
MDGMGVDGIYLYPNPNNGRFTLVFNQPGVFYGLMVYDQTGRKVYSLQLSDNYKNTVPLDLSSLSAGFYTLSFIPASGSGLVTKRLIIVK